MEKYYPGEVPVPHKGNFDHEFSYFFKFSLIFKSMQMRNFPIGLLDERNIILYHC